MASEDGIDFARFILHYSLMMTQQRENPKVEFPVLDADRMFTVEARKAPSGRTVVVVTISHVDGTETTTILPAVPANA
jgi:hypothetical protein